MAGADKMDKTFIEGYNEEYKAWMHMILKEKHKLGSITGVKRKDIKCLNCGKVVKLYCNEACRKAYADRYEAILNG